MRIRKGTYRIASSEGWKVEEGSHAMCYPFFIHKDPCFKGWSLSHVATGHNIKRNMKLDDARKLARFLQGFPLFLVPNLETFTIQLQFHKQNHPKRHAEMMKRITG